MKTIKKLRSKRIVSALLVLIMVFLMIPFGMVSVSAENDYSVPSTGHKLLSSYNVLSGTDISTKGAASALDIFNRDKLEELIDSYASYDSRHAQYGAERQGSSMESFTNSAGFSVSNSIGVNAGIDKLFKISADNKFKLSGDVSYSKALETYFYEYVITVQKGYYNFNQSHLDKIQNFSNGYLSDAFKNALTGADGSSAEEFFNTYGTHIITSYTAGGTAGIYTSTIKTEESKDVNLEVECASSIGASGTVEGIQVGGEQALALQVEIKGKNKENNCYTHSDTYAYGGEEAVCFSGGSFDFSAWANSIDAESSIILVDEHLKMIPIWNLMPVIGNEKRIIELTSYYMSKSEAQDSIFYDNYGIDETLFDYSKDWLSFENCKIITNELELNTIREDLNGVYVLANNIVLSKYSDWTPIGTKEEPFRGRLYGNNNTISGLNMSPVINKDSMSTNLIGLIGCNEGLITDLKIEGILNIPDFNTDNVFIGAIAAYNNGIVNNCFDNADYNLKNTSSNNLKLPIEKQSIESNKDYYIGNELGLYLVGQANSTYSNVNIVVEESKNVGPVYIVLENVNMVGNSVNGTIHNPTTRPIFIVSKGVSNSVSGLMGNPGTIAINAPTSDLHIYGEAILGIYGGNGEAGTAGSNGGQDENGGPGSDGKNAAIGIIANSMYVNAPQLEVYGGNGGAGGKGGSGNSAWYSSKNRSGGKGGNGGNGGDAILLTQEITISEKSNVRINGGLGGNGGKGGTSGDDGKSGKGGNGGAGGLAVNCSSFVRGTTSYVVINNGAGGVAGSAGSITGSGSSGGAGETGASGAPKAYLYIGSKRYTLYDDEKTWEDAKISAEEKSCYLATITSDSEELIINDLLSCGTLNDYYIGAYRVEDNVDSWAWVTGELFDYSMWSDDQPDNTDSNEDYVGIFRDKLSWNDYPALEKHGYIEETDLTYASALVETYLSGIAVGNNSDGGCNKNVNSTSWNQNIIQLNTVSKTEYFSGDKFESSTVKVYMYDKLISDYGKVFDSTCKGTTLSRMGYIEISKEEFVRYIPVHITKTVPDHIEVYKVGKTEFVVGEEFDISGLSLKVYYNNGTQQTLTEKSENISYTSPKIEYAGQTEVVTVFYKESGMTFSDTYEIKTVTDSVVSIFIQSLPIKLTYKQGETLNIDGLKVYENRKSGNKTLIDNKYLTFEVSPSLCNVGTSTVTIKHPSNSAIITTYTVTVEKNSAFDHTWNSGTVTIEPTHTSSGQKVFFCTIDNCSATKTETVPPLAGHTYGEWVKVNATKHQKLCECGDSIVRDHVWNSGYVIKHSTHLTTGEKLYTCTECNATETRTIAKTPEHTFGNWSNYNESQHVRSCACGEKEYLAHNWNSGVVTTPSTHIESGIKTFTCNDCKATKTEAIAPLEGHTFGEWTNYNDSQHVRSCACGEKEYLAHNWNSGVVTTPSTHTDSGIKTFTCNDCKATKTEVIEVIAGHTFGDWLDYDEEQHVRSCACGEKEYDGHSWDEGNITVEPTYTSTGLKKHICDECNAQKEEIIPALEISENAPKIIVDSKNGVIGNTLTVKISLKNNTGITSMRLNVAYDSELLKLTNVEYNSAMGGQSVLPENIDALNGTVIVYWTDGFNNYAGDDTFVTLTFLISETASENTTTKIAVTYDAEDIYDVDEVNVKFFCEDGVITFINYIPGDINGDGVVNTKDTTRLMRYLAGWDVEVNESALDVNGDGVVNTKDTTRLMRYLAGWEVDIY